jgi:uncharacterized protein (DUF433 family)
MPKIIEQNPKIMHGMPVVKGTRIPIARIVALHVQGYKLKDFKRDYPDLALTNKDLKEIFYYYYKNLAS